MDTSGHKDIFAAVVHLHDEVGSSVVILGHNEAVSLVVIIGHCDLDFVDSTYIYHTMLKNPHKKKLINLLELGFH